MKDLKGIIGNVEMKPLGFPNESMDDETPYVTHEGVLDLGELKLTVYQLNDGRRIIPESDMAKFMNYLTNQP